MVINEVMEATLIKIHYDRNNFKWTSTNINYTIHDQDRGAKQ